MKRAKRITRFILLTALGAWLLPGGLFAQANPPARVATLTYVRGQVSLQPSGQNDWSQAPLNYTITTGDRLYTDQNSRAELQVGPFAVRLSDGTDLTIANLNDQTLQLGLAQGTIRVSVYELPSNNDLEIDTPNGALTLLGPGSYRVDVDPNGGTSVVTVNSGSLQVTGGGVNQTVDAGQAVQLTGSNPIQIYSVSMPVPDDFDRWSAERDRRIESSASARYVGRYMPGYAALDQYGSWQTVPQYGPVWYPSDVNPGWVPYRVGYWSWVLPWGWNWVSQEPWGFAPFHYGRWAMFRGRWGWVPGPANVQPVYCPALVAFVGGAGMVAWFPLGPRDPYIPSYRYSGNYLRQVNITNVRNVTNITNITNVRNVHYTYRNVGVTAVPSRVFGSGQRVSAHMVRVSPQQFARAQVRARPTVAKPLAHTAYLGGKPVSAPRIQAQAARGAVARAARLPKRTGAHPTARGAALIARKAPPAAARGAGRHAVTVARNIPATRRATPRPARAPAARAAARRGPPPRRAASPPPREERAPARAAARRGPPPRREATPPRREERAPARGAARQGPPPRREATPPPREERAPARGAARQGPPPRARRPALEQRRQPEKPQKPPEQQGPGS